MDSPRKALLLHQMGTSWLWIQKTEPILNSTTPAQAYGAARAARLSNSQTAADWASCQKWDRSYSAPTFPLLPLVRPLTLPSSTRRRALGRQVLPSPTRTISPTVQEPFCQTATFWFTPARAYSKELERSMSSAPPTPSLTLQIPRVAAIWSLGKLAYWYCQAAR